MESEVSGSLLVTGPSEEDTVDNRSEELILTSEVVSESVSLESHGVDERS